MLRKQRIARQVAMLVVVAMLCTGFKCGGSDTQPQTARRQFAKAIDTYAQSVDAVFQVVVELTRAGRVSTDEAKRYVGLLREANRYGDEGRKLATDYFIANPNATDLSVDVKVALLQLLDKADEVLLHFGQVTNSDLVKALAAVAATANTLRGLLR